MPNPSSITTTLWYNSHGNTSASTTNGSVDTTFGTNTSAHTTTTAVTAPGSGSSARSAMFPVSAGVDDTLVATMDGSTLKLLFYNSAGTPDTARGSGGVVSLTGTGFNFVTGLVVTPADSIYVSGLNSSGSVSVYEWNAGGTPQSSFLASNVAPLTGFTAGLSDLALSSTGDLLVGWVDSTGTLKAVALDPITGTPDVHFGTGGVASIPVTGSTTNIVFAGLAVEPDGEVVEAAAFLSGSAAYQFALAGFTPAGAADGGFGIGGLVTGSFGAATAFLHLHLGVTAPGNLLLASSTNSSTKGFYLERFSDEGVRDMSFGSAGLAGVAITAKSPNLTLDLLANGQIVVGGNAGSGQLVLARFNCDGTLDTSFGSGGVVTGPVNIQGLASTTTATGETVVVGSTTGGLTLQAFHTAAPAQRLYVEQDADYNTVSLTDLNGKVVERYVYDPYGAVTVLNPDGTVRGDGSAAGSYYGFVYLHQGLRLSVTTNTYDDRRRIYLVSLGRFDEEDPAGYVNGSDLYNFGLNNPTKYTDPSGLVVPSQGRAPYAPPSLPVPSTISNPADADKYAQQAWDLYKTLPPNSWQAQGVWGYYNWYNQRAKDLRNASAQSLRQLASGYDCGVTINAWHAGGMHSVTFNLNSPGDPFTYKLPGNSGSLSIPTNTYLTVGWDPSMGVMTFSFNNKVNLDPGGWSPSVDFTYLTFDSSGRLIDTDASAWGVSAFGALQTALTPNSQQIWDVYKSLASLDEKLQSAVAQANSAINECKNKVQELTKELQALQSSLPKKNR